jgi:hypothetical protein
MICAPHWERLREQVPATREVAGDELCEACLGRAAWFD